jgi:hypothetical protein
MMNLGLLKTAKIAQSIAFQVSATRDSVAMHTSVATDDYITWLLPQIFRKLRPMACEEATPFGLYSIKECAMGAIEAMQKAQLKLDDGLLFTARIEFEDSSFGFLLLRTNKEIDAIDTNLKAITASDFKKGLLAMLMHVTHDDNGEITETFYTFDSHFKRDNDDWNLFLNLAPIVDDYEMTKDLMFKLRDLVHDSGLNGFQKLQLQQICIVNLCSQAATEFSIADLLKPMQDLDLHRSLMDKANKSLDYKPLSDLGLFVVDANAIRDHRKQLSAKLKLNDEMIISYHKEAMPALVEGGYGSFLEKYSVFTTTFEKEVFE